MSLPVIDLLRGWPTDLRELGRVLGDLNIGIRKTRNRIFSPDQRFMGQVAVSNKQSAQNAQPLSSTDSGGGFAEIAIAAHTVRNSQGLVSYNAGTIAGVPNATIVYVYVADPEFEGGAVSYSYTTDKQTVPSSLDNYYLGKITTAAGGGGGTTGGGGAGGGGGGTEFP